MTSGPERGTKSEERPDPPTEPAAAIILSYRIKPERRRGFLSFIRTAFETYESPGGIRMSLYESVDEPGFFVEIAAYDTLGDYDRDQIRVETDREMIATLGAFRSHIEGQIDVRRLRRAPSVEPGL